MTSPYRYEPSEPPGATKVYHGDTYLGSVDSFRVDGLLLFSRGGFRGQARTLAEAADKMARIYRVHNGPLPGENQ